MNKRFHPFKERIICLYSKCGYSIKELSNHYGLDRATLRKYLKEYNVYEKRETLTDRNKRNKNKTMIKKYGVVNPGEINNPKMQKRKSEKLSKIRKGKWSGKNNPNYGNFIGNNFGFKGGLREDLNVYFRSSWEANVARILSYLNIEWYFEPKRFVINEKETYTPDFYIPSFDAWLEIKGYWFDDAYRKFSMFKELYPNLKVKVIGKDKYQWLIGRYNFVSNLE